MFFSTITHPNIGHRGFYPAGRTLQSFLSEAKLGANPGSCRIEQDDKSYTLTFDVPGVARDQLNIGIEGAVVRVETNQDAPRRYRHVYELPQDLDASASQAKLEHGVLTLTLAKQIEPSRVTKINIQ